jgi:hypothetical protein
MAMGSAVGLKIRGNTIRNAGSSLDASLNAGYKSPIFALSVTGALQADIEGNTIIDDLAVSRMVQAMTLGGAANASHHVRVLGNSIHLLGANTGSLRSNVSLLDNNLRPFIHMIEAAN